MNASIFTRGFWLILLNALEKPGVYVALRKDGTENLRIEKLE